MLPLFDFPPWNAILGKGEMNWHESAWLSVDVGMISLLKELQTKGSSSLWTLRLERGKGRERVWSGPSESGESVFTVFSSCSGKKALAEVPEEDLSPRLQLKKPRMRVELRKASMQRACLASRV